MSSIELAIEAAHGAIRRTFPKRPEAAISVRQYDWREDAETAVRAAVESGHLIAADDTEALIAALGLEQVGWAVKDDRHPPYDDPTSFFPYVVFTTRAEPPKPKWSHVGHRCVPVYRLKGKP